MTRILALMFLFVSVTAELTGCAPRQRPFMTVEVCLKDAAGMSAFKQEIQNIGRSHDLSVIDDSTRAESEVDKIASEEFRKKLGRPVVSMIVKHDDKVIAMVGNIGLPSGQVVLSFFDNSTFATHRLANSVVEHLEASWRIEFVPAGQGALGIEDCT